MIRAYPIDPPEEIVDRDRIREEAGAVIDDCPHQETQIRRRVCSNGATQFVAQCVTCGHTSQPIAHGKLTEAEKAGAAPIERTIARGRWELRQAEIERRLEAERERLSEERRRWYLGYLASEVWQERRALVMARSGGTCEACGVEPAEHVHHKTYENVGREPLFDLVAVCASCHADLHGILGDYEEHAGMLDQIYTPGKQPETGPESASNRRQTGGDSTAMLKQKARE